MDAIAQMPPSSVSLTNTSTGKQSAAELLQPDADEQKKSPVAVAWQQSFTGTHVVSRSDTHAF